MLASNDISGKKFERSTLGGYRNDEVDSFLNQVADTVQQLEEQNYVLNKKLEVLAEKLEEYRNDEESLRSALLGAQKLGDSVIRESKNKAEIIMRDATIKSERLIAHAKDQVEKEKLVYIKLQKDVASFKNKLLATYKQHLEIISSLPEDPFKEITEDGVVIEPAPQQKRESVQPQQPQKREPVQPPPVATNPPSREAVDDDIDDVAAPEATPRAPIMRERPRQEEIAAEEQEEEVVVPPRKRSSVPRFSYTPSKHRTPMPEDDEVDEEESVPTVAGQKIDPVVLQTLNLTAEEYYEVTDGEESRAALPKKISKFGTLKFGAGYDLNRE